MKQKLEKVFFALIRFQFGKELSQEIKNLITEELLSPLFELSKQHDLAHLVGDALDKNGLLPKESQQTKRFLQERNLAMYRYVQQQYEFEQICQTLENAKIPFVPLKGAVIRQFYSQPWMRTSCDIDILVQEHLIQDAINTLQNELKYKLSESTNHDVHLYSSSGVHLELHYKLTTEPKYNDLAQKVWNNLVQTEGYCKQMSWEYFFWYHIVHMVGHFMFGGCGVRSFLDLWVLNQKVAFDKFEFNKMLFNSKLTSFFDAVSSLSYVWFEESTSNPVADELCAYVLYAGMYGDMRNRVIVQQSKKGGKKKYLFSRIFLPYEKMQHRYPVLKKHKWLTPFYHIKRLLGLFNKKNREGALKEYHELQKVQTEKQKRIEKLVKDLDL